MKKTLPSIRVSDETSVHMRMAIDKYNNENIVTLTEQEFRRLSYEVLSQFILQNKPIPFKLR